MLRLIKEFPLQVGLFLFNTGIFAWLQTTSSAILAQLNLKEPLSQYIPEPILALTGDSVAAHSGLCRQCRLGLVDFFHDRPGYYPFYQGGSQVPLCGGPDCDWSLSAFPKSGDDSLLDRWLNRQGLMFSERMVVNTDWLMIKAEKFGIVFKTQ